MALIPLRNSASVLAFRGNSLTGGMFIFKPTVAGELLASGTFVVIGIEASSCGRKLERPSEAAWKRIFRF